MMQVDIAELKSLIVQSKQPFKLRSDQDMRRYLIRPKLV